MNNKVEKIYNEYLRETFYYVTHRSGLKIIFVPKKLSSFYALYGVGYGSLDCAFRCEGEKDFIKVPDGIAHYLEHKMFESPDGTDAFALFSKNGANANAFTTNNLTAYLFSCTANFRENLRSLLKFVNEPYFTEETVEKERGIISEEIEMYEDDPYSSLHYGMLELLYINNPVKINVAGTTETIKQITHEHLYRCYNAFYTPQNMVLSISGDTDIESVLSVCDEVLSDIQTGFKTERAEFFEPDEVKEKRGSVRRLVSQPLFCIGIKDRVLESPGERFKRSVAASIIMDSVFGTSSDFFSELYNNGTVNSMSSGHDSMKNYAFSYIIGESKNPEQVYSCFVKKAQEVSEHGINEEDFKRIKKVTVANYVNGFDSTENIATEALFMELEGMRLCDYGKIISEVDIKYVCKLAKEMFCDVHYAMMTVLPKK